MTDFLICGARLVQPGVSVADGDLLIRNGNIAAVGQVSPQETAGATVIVSGWYGDGPNFATGNTFGSATPACKVSQPRIKGPGDYCAGRRGICWN